MSNQRKIVWFLLVCFLCGCSNSENKKTQTKRNNIVSAKDDIIEIDFGDVIMGISIRVCIAHEFLVIADHRA